MSGHGDVEGGHADVGEVGGDVEVVVGLGGIHRIEILQVRPQIFLRLRLLQGIVVRITFIRVAILLRVLVLLTGVHHVNDVVGLVLAIVNLELLYSIVLILDRIS